MLTEWTIGNFKSIARRVNLQLAPLTIVCGPNSSGKSTLIQSILMVAQTLASPATHRALILNGEWVKLGYLSDIAHGGDMHESMNLGFQLVKKGRRSSTSTQEIDIDATFFKSSDPDPNSTKVNVITSSLRANDLRIRASGQSGNNLLSAIYRHKKWQIPDGLKDEISSGLFDFDLVEYGENHRIDQREMGFCSLSHFLPSKKLSQFSVGAEGLRSAINDAAKMLQMDSSTRRRSHINDIEFRSVTGKHLQEELVKIVGKLRRGKDLRSEALIQELATIEGLLYRSPSLLEWVENVGIKTTTRTQNALARELLYYATSKEVVGPGKEISVKAETISPEVIQATNEIIDFFTKRMRYLGPLRDDPHMVYGIPLIPDSKDVGVKGEYTAAVLERFGKDIRIECPVPPDGEYSPLRSTTMPLIDAVIHWLQHMDLVDNVITQDRGKMGIELTLSSEGLKKQLDLTNVGVGVSQVLPILTMCLLAPDDGLILLEQPELHLHPRVQMMLSDFLLGIAARGTQCIVETHSDRVINRIRRRIAEDESDEVMRLSKFYFFEKSGVETRILSVEPNEFGAITRWPKGFFDEGPDESQYIVQAANRKREARLQKSKHAPGSNK